MSSSRHKKNQKALQKRPPLPNWMLVHIWKGGSNPFIYKIFFFIEGIIDTLLIYPQISLSTNLGQNLVLVDLLTGLGWSLLTPIRPTGKILEPGFQDKNTESKSVVKFKKKLHCWLKGPKMPYIIRVTIDNKNKLRYHPFKGEHLFWEKKYNINSKIE